MCLRVLQIETSHLLYYDGIGMVRSFIDEGEALVSNPDDEASLRSSAESLRASGCRVLLLSGAGSAPVVRRFIDSTPLAGLCEVVPIENRYFGGNVNVTGLLCACDVLDQLDPDLSGRVVFLPDIMLNSDRLTLDGVLADDLVAQLASRGARGFFVTSVPQGLKRAFEAL